MKNRIFTRNSRGLGLAGKWLKILISGALFALVVPLISWSTAAIWFDGPKNRWIAAGLAAVYAIASLAAVIKIRPYRRSALCFCSLFAVVLCWWLTIKPSNDRDWMPDVARPASATIEGTRVTLKSLRNFDYRSETDYSEHWETRTFDLDDIKGFDIFLCYWGPTLIAHTISSWEFKDGSHLAISIETRKEKGEEYSAVKGFFRQYELYYVVADERDVIGLRTNYRGEQVYLYRFRMSKKIAVALLKDYLAEINQLAFKPRWYNALTHNCTTDIRYHFMNLGLAKFLDWRILVNGRIDELFYERHVIDTTLPFAETRKRCNITARARAAGKSVDFSRQIRVGVPGQD